MNSNKFESVINACSILKESRVKKNRILKEGIDYYNTKGECISMSGSEWSLWTALLGIGEKFAFEDEIEFYHIERSVRFLDRVIKYLESGGRTPEGFKDFFNGYKRMFDVSDHTAIENMKFTAKHIRDFLANNSDDIITNYDRVEKRKEEEFIDKLSDDDIFEVYRKRTIALDYFRDNVVNYINKVLGKHYYYLKPETFEEIWNTLSDEHKNKIKQYYAYYAKKNGLW